MSLTLSFSFCFLSEMTLTLWSLEAPKLWGANTANSSSEHGNRVAEKRLLGK
jgi:hypothetical protein